MAYIFLDESGQFNKQNKERYFIVASFTTGDHKRTNKKFKQWTRERFPRASRHQNEIKFSQNNIDDKLRLRTLKYLANLDVRINYCYLLRKNIPDMFWKKNRLQSGTLYTHIIGEVIDQYMPINDRELRVFCDQRKLLGITNNKFKKILTERTLPKVPSGSIIQIEMVDSTSSHNIQIADWITGALARYLENKNLGTLCFEMLKNNIIKEGKELFGSYWDDDENKNPNRND